MEEKKKRKGKNNFKKRATSWFKCHAGVEQGEKWKYSFQYLFMALCRKESPFWCHPESQGITQNLFLALFPFPLNPWFNSHLTRAQAGSFSVLTTIDLASFFFFTSFIYTNYFAVVKLPFLLLFLSIIIVQNFFKLKREKEKEKVLFLPFQVALFHPSLVLSLAWLVLYGLRLLNRRVFVVCLIQNHDFPENCSNLGFTSRWSYT